MRNVKLGWKEWTKWQKRPGQPYDIFLMSMSNVNCPATILTWILHSFRGKVVFISGESESEYGLGTMRNDGLKYTLGPVPKEGPQAMPLTYLQMTWWAVFRPLYDTNHNPNSEEADQVLVDLAHKPKNDDQHFLIYSASNCVGFRQEAFDQLSTIGLVHYGGKCRGRDTGDSSNNNKTGFTNGVSLRNWWDNVEHVYHHFRFCLVMEHVSQVNYITEKILMAFLGGCIPIYYGSEKILDIFNPQAFVFYNVTSPTSALDRIRYLELNRTAYWEVLRHQPILADDNVLRRYFSFDDNVGDGHLKQKIRHMLELDRYEFVP